MSAESGPRILIVAGPTGVGKTALALDIAEAVGAEIISADSVQIYRGMDIGSAKPTLEDRRRVRHHLIDVVSPDEPFSAGRYARLAAAAIDDIVSRGKKPVVVGGSGLYIRALLGGLVAGVEAAPEVRRPIAERLARRGIRDIRERLRKVDPVSAARIHANDAYRMTRALEVYELTGKPLSEMHAGHAWGSERFEARWIGLTEERPRLYAQIEARCEEMIRRGFIEEVAALEKAGYNLDSRPLRSLGYRQMGEVLRGHRTMEAALAEMKKETRRYAKRQLTWFRSEKKTDWFSPSAGTRVIIERAAGLLA